MCVGERITWRKTTDTPTHLRDSVRAIVVELEAICRTLYVDHSETRATARTETAKGL
jgi:hypothetical protein